MGNSELVFTVIVLDMLGGSSGKKTSNRQGSHGQQRKAMKNNGKQRGAAASNGKQQEKVWP